LDIDPADYLPPVFPTQTGRADAPVFRTPGTAHGRDAGSANLATLLAGVLFAFTLDFESVSRIALPTSANTLRVLDNDGVRLRDLPILTGVSKEANAMCSGWLQRHGCAEQARDPNAARGQVLRLTAKGRPRGRNTCDSCARRRRTGARAVGQRRSTPPERRSSLS
jgi:hypothetical protein